MNLLSNITNSINSNNLPIISDNTTASSSSHDSTTSPVSSPSSRYSTLNIGSLNCRGLTKTASTSTRDQFIRYLRYRSLDLVALQETHASTTSIKEMFHTQFQASSSIWSSHCGLVSFSPNIKLSNSFISPCERFISTTVSHTSNLFDPITVTVVYFSASRTERFSYMSNFQQTYRSTFPSSPSRTIILGDFNYTNGFHSSYGRIRQAPTDWLTYIDNNFIEGVTKPGLCSSPTFHRGVSQSCIDYIFVSTDLSSSINFEKSLTSFIQPLWSDHFLLSIQLLLQPPIDASSSATATGKGLWRAHPNLARNSAFKKRLHLDLTKCTNSLNPSLSAADKWELLKKTTANTCKSFSRREAFNLTRAEDLLHKKRSGLQKKINSDHTLLPIISPQLAIVEHQLASIQQFHVETLALRSGIRWRELGELSPGYLKHTIASRSNRQSIPPLIHHQTQSLCTTQKEMLETTAFFYSNLYSPDEVDDDAIETLLSRIPESLRLSSSEADAVIAPITYDDLLFAFSRTPKKSSPGMDGLPYAIIRLIIKHPDCREIALATFNNALSLADIPPSWMQSCVTLLAKKGTLDLLKNWRPISLINTDAKVFTRILSSRIIDSAANLITPYQTGFVRDRFIADNGLLMKLIMEHANITHSSSIGLLLDQEKAYDRVHPTYLRAVLTHFGYPAPLVTCINRLFFGTHLNINVNGFLTDSIPQHRGLKQGDPLSPILFNLAFEPLLRSIQHDLDIKGYLLPPSIRSSSPNELSSPVKLMAYADDIVCLLNSPSELTSLHNHLNLYSRASNARINFDKTEAISLSGSPKIYGDHWRLALNSYHITSWHDCLSSNPVIYLGFPLFTSTNQRNIFLDSFLEKIQISCDIHSQRALSIRGRATVLNSLILSKLWHVLRVVSVPTSFFKSVQSIISKFINFHIFPKISFSTACLSRSQGGLGLLNPFIQQMALQLRWLHPILSTATDDLHSDAVTGTSMVFVRLISFLYSQIINTTNDPLHPSSSIELDHRFFFLFPLRRPKTVCQLNSSLALLFKAIDMFPKDYSNVVVSAATCLEIPLGSLTIPSIPLRRSTASLLSSTVYTFDINRNNCLRPRLSSEINKYPVLSKSFLKQVSKRTIRLTPFFVRSFISKEYAHLGLHPFVPIQDHSIINIVPFLIDLQLVNSSGSSPTRFTTKMFRHLHSQSPVIPILLPPPFSPTLSISWSTFWGLPLSHSCRNIWYRIIQKKIPHKSLLHALIPDRFPDSICSICLNPVESLLHFFITCPPKLHVWHTIWHRHIDPSTLNVPLDIIQVALFTLKLPVLSHGSKTSHLTVIAAIIETIWRSHWALIFNETPFISANVLATTEKKIIQSRQESFLMQGIPHAPLPHISAD